MRTIVLEEPGRFTSQDREPPRRENGLALVRIHRVGVCGTDLHAFAGRQPFFSYPRILGHELGVSVLEVPPNDRGIRPGDRCAVEPYLNCGQCHSCVREKPNCCEQLQVLGVHTDGGMRGLLNVPVERLHRSDLLDFDQLALVETLGIGAHAVARGAVKAGESVHVVGAGPIGLAVVQFALAVGAHVRVQDVSAPRREFVASLGVETLAEPDGRLADVVFDATGNAQAMQASFELVAFGGRLVFVGLVQGTITFDDPLFHRRELTLLASRNSCNDFSRIVGMIERGEIDTSPWITHRLRLADVPAAFAGLRAQPNLVKAMIHVEDRDL